MIGSEKSSRVKLNISSAASSAPVETKSIPEMLELIAGEACSRFLRRHQSRKTQCYCALYTAVYSVVVYIMHVQIRTVLALVYICSNCTSALR